MLHAFGVTDRGHVRQTNEDCYGVDLGLRLCVVADGMGGHNAGEVAASLAVETILSCIRTGTVPAAWPYDIDPAASQAGNLLCTALHVANKAILDLACSSPVYSGMGTTVVAILERDGVLSVAHAGDSRAYVCGPDGLRQLTEDDSWLAAVLSRDPEIDPAMFRQHPMRHALTNVVGSRLGMTAHLTEHALTPGDRFVLTSDGVHGVLDAGEIATLIRKGSDPEQAATRLMEAALAGGSRDNCTVIIADYQPD